jgi:two-component system NtrC family sensor kinase
MFEHLVQTDSRQSRTIESGGMYVRASMCPLHDEGGHVSGAVYTISDITERKRLEAGVLAAERALQKQRLLKMHGDRLRSLGEMSAGIAHELNQPLVGVRGLAEHLLLAMQRGWDLPEEKIQEKLRLVIQQADRMSHIIDHVRVFAREAGKPDCRPVEWDKVIDSGLQMVGAQLRSRGITVVTELAEDLPCVLANPFSLEEVLLNLLSNARDAVEQRGDVEEGPRTADIRLRTSLRRNGSDWRAELKVIDRGIGISDGRIERVFDPFYTTKPADQGTGLGLSICRSIVAQFNGEIVLHSTVGVGTTVTVSLPASLD